MRRADARLATVLVAALAAAAAAAEPAASGRPSGAEMVRLRAGETLVEMAETGGGSARRLLDADPGRLFRAAADWAHYDEFFPFVRASSAERGADGRVLGRQTVDVPWPYADRSFTATVEWSRRPSAADGGFEGRVAWALVPGSGAVRENRGEWRFSEPEPGRTLVELRLASDLDGVPAGFERRALAETLPHVIDGLRQQANRCRYDLPRHPTCGEEPPFPDAAADAAGAEAAGSAGKPR